MAGLGVPGFGVVGVHDVGALGGLGLHGRARRRSTQNTNEAENLAGSGVGEDLVVWSSGRRNCRCTAPVFGVGGVLVGFTSRRHQGNTTGKRETLGMETRQGVGDMETHGRTRLQGRTRKQQQHARAQHGSKVAVGSATRHGGERAWPRAAAAGNTRMGSGGEEHERRDASEERWLRRRRRAARGRPVVEQPWLGKELGWPVMEVLDAGRRRTATT